MIARIERDHARSQLTYTQRMNSCVWEPEERVHWYDKGYGQARVYYSTQTTSEVLYAAQHYEPQSKQEYGSYERGYFHACVDILSIRDGIEYTSVANA